VVAIDLAPAPRSVVRDVNFWDVPGLLAQLSGATG
jgi:hypothetical protein